MDLRWPPLFQNRTTLEQPGWRAAAKQSLTSTSQGLIYELVDYSEDWLKLTDWHRRRRRRSAQPAAVVDGREPISKA